MNNIEKCILEKSSQSITQAANKIEQNCQSMTAITEKFHQEKWKISWKLFASAIFTGIITSLLMAWILIPKPTLPLTAEQLTYLQQGQMLVQMWPKLTKLEKDRLRAISNEVLHSSG